MCLNQAYRVVQVQFAPLLDVRRHGGAEHGHVAPTVVVTRLEYDSQLKKAATIFVILSISNVAQTLHLG